MLLSICGAVYCVALSDSDLTFKSEDETPACDQSNESYWAVLLIMLLKVVNFLDKTLVCDHSKESYWAALSQCIVVDRIWFILHFRNIQLSAKGIPLGHPCHHKRQGYHSILLTTLSLWRNTEWRATHRLINKGEQCIWCSFHTR